MPRMAVAGQTVISRVVVACAPDGIEPNRRPSRRAHAQRAPMRQGTYHPEAHDPAPGGDADPALVAHLIADASLDTVGAYTQPDDADRNKCSPS